MSDWDIIFRYMLPVSAKYHLDVGSRSGFKFPSLVKSENLLCNEVDRTVTELQDTPYFLGSALEISKFLKPHLFDLITCFDVIEHFTKEDGFKLIGQLEELSNDTILYFTPVGDVWIGEDKVKYHTHLSGWIPEEFVKLGYNCWVFPKCHGAFGGFFAIKSKTLCNSSPVFQGGGIFKDNYWVIAKDGK